MAKKKAEKKPEPVAPVVHTGLVGPGGVPIKSMEPAFSFTSAFQIWQGAPKTGKTSTAAMLGQAARELGITDPIDPFFLLFERGSGGFEVNATSEPCKCKEGTKKCPECGGRGVVRKVLTEIEEAREWFAWASQSPFNPLVIDTGDGLFQVISDAVCVKLGIDSPMLSDHGVAWWDIYDHVRELFATISNKAIIVLMHVYYRTKRVKGGEVQVAQFNISGKSQQYLQGLANQILHFEVAEGGEGKNVYSVLSRPTAGVEAGDHWGLFPEELNRGESALEGAKQILRCFYEV